MRARTFHLDSEGAPAALLVDELRAIALTDLLVWHGLVPKAEGASHRAKDERFNIVATGSRWFDNKAGVGGGGAIDLQMHLAGEDFLTACRTLATQFRPLLTARQSIEFPPVRSCEIDRIPLPVLLAKYAVQDASNWPQARDYLTETRCITPALVDELHAAGMIYANDHRPAPSLVFLHRNENGHLVGATLRDTRPGSSFRPCFGNKLSSWFAVGNVWDANSIVAVESPIDALSYHTIFVGQNDRIAVVSCSGATVPHELMVHAYDRRQSLVVALDYDAAGARGWQRARDATADWAGFKISSECPSSKDWNADLIALRAPAARQTHRQPLSHG